MGIRLDSSATKALSRQKITNAFSEAVVQGIMLGKAGFGNPLPALFRIIDSLKGEDRLELRAYNIISEAILLASIEVICTSSYKCSPNQKSLKDISRNIANLINFLIEEEQCYLSYDDLRNPNSISFVEKFTLRFYSELQSLSPAETERSLIARFKLSMCTSIQKVRLRKPEYYSILIESMTGPDELASSYVRIWQLYRSELIKKYEMMPIFGEDEIEGVTISQVYVPLRAFWSRDIDENNSNQKSSDSVASLQSREDEAYSSDMETAIIDWLALYDKSDFIRLVSGGPGSGKSTFAKRLAASFAAKVEWRTLLVPLQRIESKGNLQNRINDYFTSYDEPFQKGNSPIQDIGSDGFKDWLIIFDGLDELAKEGEDSEKTAQEFASSLIDWASQVGRRANIRFIVLGRAPSMQEASQRLALSGDKILHVADFRPLESQGFADEIIGDIDIVKEDQRVAYWQRWALAKGLKLQVPAALSSPELSDLTKEPLLCHLLIMSGYSGKNWIRAAENKNLVYEGIFEQIYDRERKKDSRNYLNTLGKDGFSALMQALGLAAWRGGGRTGDQRNFIDVRDAFVKRNILNKVSELGMNNLSNVAILFYTRKDQTGQQGYEFIHKSFGEYLTARALIEAFVRWSAQVENEDDEFGEADFISRWVKIASSTRVTVEILDFMMGEARLYAARMGGEWKR